MSDPLAAILSIPPAIDACKNIISSLVGHLSREPNKQDDARKAREQITEIGELLITFTDFTETLRKWKELHNVTQAILYADLPETLGLVARGQGSFVADVARRTDIIHKEFQQLTRGARGAFLLMNTLDDEDFEIADLPKDIVLIGGNWGSHLKRLGGDAAAAFTKGQFHDLFESTEKLQGDCMLLNVRADAKLKDGLSAVTRTMHDLRNEIKAGKARAPH
jgi:hypothetical protein